MGTAQVQGELWGTRAKDWAEANEPAWLPVYQAVLDQAGVRTGSRLLDIGCGAGGALVMAHQRGAEVSGLDASQNLVTIARRRLPNASIEVGEMEELPFDNEAFDAVTGINSFQFAGDIVQALRQANRVCKHGGTVAMLVWGKKEDCDLVNIVLPPVFALMPPTPAAASPAFAERGVMESLMRQAELSPLEAREINEPLVFPDPATATRAIMSAMTRAIRHAGEDAVKRAVVDGLARIATAGGPVVLKSRFRLLTAIRE